MTSHVIVFMVGVLIGYSLAAIVNLIFKALSE